MKDSTIKYLSHEYRVIAEMENRIEELKSKKLDYIKSLEKRFKRNGSLKEAQQRLKDHLSRYPKGAEAKKLKSIEDSLRHVIKQLKIKTEHVERVRLKDSDI